MEVYGRMQTVVVYPVTLADFYGDIIRKQTEAASAVDLTVEDTMPGQPPKGSVLVTKPSIIVAVSYIFGRIEL